VFEKRIACGLAERRRGDLHDPERRLDLRQLAVGEVIGPLVIARSCPFVRSHE
jgi:hypothetical protein